MEIIEQKSERDQEFNDAVNDGYMLAKNNPTHLEQLIYESEQTNANLYKGYTWGKWLYEEEKQKQTLKEIKAIQNLKKDRDKEFELGF